MAQSWLTMIMMDKQTQDPRRPVHMYQNLQRFRDMPVTGMAAKDHQLQSGAEYCLRLSKGISLPDGRNPGDLT